MPHSTLCHSATRTTCGLYACGLCVGTVRAAMSGPHSMLAMSRSDDVLGFERGNVARVVSEQFMQNRRGVFS